MARLASQGKTDMKIREAALSLTGNLPGKDYAAEIERLFRFVRDRIRYTRDVHGVETVQTPTRTLEYGAGDCDDQVTLLSALLGAIGFPTRFVAVGFQPGHLEHVYLEVNDRGEWIALDPTEPVGVGWKPPEPATSIIERVD